MKNTDLANKETSLESPFVHGFNLELEAELTDDDYSSEAFYRSPFQQITFENDNDSTTINKTYETEEAFEVDSDEYEIDEFDAVDEMSANEFSPYEDNQYSEELDQDFESEEHQELEEAFAFGLDKLKDTWQKLKNSTASPKPLPTVSPNGRPLLLPIVSSFLPDSLNYLKTRKSPKHYYGIPETIAALQWIGKEWVKLRHNVKLIIRDISQMGGGRIPGHGSHRMGIDVDIRLSINGKLIRSHGPNYRDHRMYVRDFVHIVKRNPYLSIAVIGFIDRVLNREFTKLVKPWKNHSQHLHLRFCMPSKRLSKSDFKKVYPNGSKGSFKTCGEHDVKYTDPVLSSAPTPKSASTTRPQSINIQGAIKYN